MGVLGVGVARPARGRKGGRGSSCWESTVIPSPPSLSNTCALNAQCVFRCEGDLKDLRASHRKMWSCALSGGHMFSSSCTVRALSSSWFSLWLPRGVALCFSHNPFQRLPWCRIPTSLPCLPQDSRIPKKKRLSLEDAFSSL